MTTATTPSLALYSLLQKQEHIRRFIIILDEMHPDKRSHLEEIHDYLLNQLREIDDFLDKPQWRV